MAIKKIGLFSRCLAFLNKAPSRVDPNQKTSNQIIIGGSSHNPQGVNLDELQVFTVYAKNDGTDNGDSGGTDLIQTEIYNGTDENYLLIWLYNTDKNKGIYLSINPTDVLEALDSFLPGGKKDKITQLNLTCKMVDACWNGKLGRSFILRSEIFDEDGVIGGY